jgi:hypothetical protein
MEAHQRAIEVNEAYQAKLASQKAAGAYSARLQGMADAYGDIGAKGPEAAAGMDTAAEAARRSVEAHAKAREAANEHAQTMGSLAANLKDATEKQVAESLISMLDVDELGAEGYTTAVTEIGQSFGIMDEKSIALADNLPKLAEALEGSVIPAENADEALAALVDDASDGVVNFGELLTKFDNVPAKAEPMTEKLLEMDPALQPLPGLAGQTADGIGSIGDRAVDATGKLQGFIDTAKNLPGSLAIPTAGAGGGPSVPGYASGGTVPGPLGAPQLAVVHGGETIIPAGGGGGGNVSIKVDVNLNAPAFFEDRNAVNHLANRITQGIRQQGAYRGGAVRGL